jgi:predicted nucleic acid-binding protein
VTTHGSQGSKFVVDSWALLAWIFDEPAAARVEAMLVDAAAGRAELALSWINAAETFYILAKRSSLRAAEEFLARLPSLPIRVELPDERGVIAAARIQAGNRVAFGDAFAMALAEELDAAVITGDEEIRRCRVVPVEWIGSAQRAK